MFWKWLFLELLGGVPDTTGNYNLYYNRIKMFSRVIPNWGIIKDFTQPLTEGEIVLLKYLDENLQKDNYFKEGNSLEKYTGWLIFAQPYLNGSRPDIIIFHPKVGVQIFEVKDWNLDNYSFQKNEKGNLRFCVTDNRGTYEIKSPIKQVEYYHEKITGLLVPQIGELIDENERNYGLVRTALYFQNAKTEEVQNLFRVKIKDFNKMPAFGKDALKKENLRKIVPNSYLRNSYYWREEWNKEILFWLTPPFHSLEQTTKLTLNDDQKKFAGPQSGHHRVRGGAGSGKTQVLAYRAGKLASQDCLSITLLTSSSCISIQSR